MLYSLSEREEILRRSRSNYDFFYRDYTDDSQWWKCQHGYGECYHSECKPVTIIKQPVINEKPVERAKVYNPPVKQVKPSNKRIDITDDYLRG